METNKNIAIDGDPRGEQPAAEHQELRGSSRHRAFGKTIVALTLTLLLLAGFVAVAISVAKKIPDRYLAVLDIDSKVAAKEGQQFERNLIRLQNASKFSKPWRVEITQDQINGWLVSDLPEKFPDSLPAGIEDPRVIIKDESLDLVFKVSQKSLQGVIVVETDVFCTQIPNEIAMKIVSARAGFVPLPIGPWLERITLTLNKIGVPMYWTTDESDPVAVFTVPEHMTRKGANFRAVVDSIEIKNGKLVIVGQTKVDENQSEDSGSTRVAELTESDVSSNEN